MELVEPVVLPVLRNAGAEWAVTLMMLMMLMVGGAMNGEQPRI